MNDEGKPKIRFRYVYMGIGTVLTMIVFLLSDPTGGGGALRNLPFGAGVAASVIMSLWIIFYVLFLHLSRMALMDYVHLSQFFKKALGTPEGAGLAVIGVAIMTLAVSMIIAAVILSGSGFGMF